GVTPHLSQGQVVERHASRVHKCRRSARPSPTPHVARRPSLQRQPCPRALCAYQVTCPWPELRAPPSVRHSHGPPNGGGGGGLARGGAWGAVRRSLWRQCGRCVHGERLRWPSSGARHPGAGTARMSASLVRATVRAVSKRKLQPTRAALTLTPSAVNKIKQLLKDKPEHVGLKVGVRTRGCNGLSYTLEYTKTKGDSDEEVVQDGVRVFIEKKAQLTLLGTEMDYVEDKLSMSPPRWSLQLA
uniref:Iron-sulfur cluster assembly 1 homolog, mitochondrial n=1 Tax=Lynx canadensis TaxID=61383 RepID=A0A667H7F1_LYNCA